MSAPKLLLKKIQLSPKFSNGGTDIDADNSDIESLIEKSQKFSTSKQPGLPGQISLEEYLELVALDVLISGDPRKLRNNIAGRPGISEKEGRQKESNSELSPEVVKKGKRKNKTQKSAQLLKKPYTKNLKLVRQVLLNKIVADKTLKRKFLAKLKKQKKILGRKSNKDNYTPLNSILGGFIGYISIHEFMKSFAISIPVMHGIEDFNKNSLTRSTEIRNITSKTEAALPETAQNAAYKKLLQEQMENWVKELLGAKTTKERSFAILQLEEIIKQNPTMAKLVPEETKLTISRKSDEKTVSNPAVLDAPRSSMPKGGISRNVDGEKSFVANLAEQREKAAPQNFVSRIQNKQSGPRFDAETIVKLTKIMEKNGMNKAEFYRHIQEVTTKTRDENIEKYAAKAGFSEDKTKEIKAAGAKKFTDRIARKHEVSERTENFPQSWAEMIMAEDRGTTTIHRNL